MREGKRMKKKEREEKEIYHIERKGVYGGKVSLMKRKIGMTIAL
jgi:CRISPR/Cas system-associated protein Cas7 (RAMP superfamily)